MRRPFYFALATLFIATLAFSQSVPSAIFTDPPTDPAHPARMSVLHIPTHGFRINGLIYQASGAGPHPTMVLCHGLPGNEKNLDLAQAVRRAGWNAVTFNYRGSWGSPGMYRFTQNLEDGAAVLAWLREPETAKRLGIDTTRIVIAGHSMGGWVAAHTASHDPALIGVILISAWNAGRVNGSHQSRVDEMADNMESLAGTAAETMANELEANAKMFALENAAQGLVHMPLLALTADDGLAPDTDALVKAVEAKGGHRITSKHVATDHAWSDHRIALEGTVIEWLAGLH